MKIETTPEADPAITRPRSADRLLELLRHKNWIPTADLKRAVRAKDRHLFENNAELLQQLGFTERRPLANGHGTETRLRTGTPPPNAPDDTHDLGRTHHTNPDS